MGQGAAGARPGDQDLRDPRNQVLDRCTELGRVEVAVAVHHRRPRCLVDPLQAHVQGAVGGGDPVHRREIGVVPPTGVDAGRCGDDRAGLVERCAGEVVAAPERTDVLHQQCIGVGHAVASVVVDGGDPDLEPGRDLLVEPRFSLVDPEQHTEGFEAAIGRGDLGNGGGRAGSGLCVGQVQAGELAEEPFTDGDLFGVDGCDGRCGDPCLRKGCGEPLGVERGDRAGDRNGVAHDGRDCGTGLR